MKPKRKILILDAFTNGDDAARKFISRQGWKIKECDIVFCGSHDYLLKKLTEGPAFAVVPVFNSTKGAVTSVTDQIKMLREFGYQFDLVDTLHMRINHFLMAPQHIRSIKEIQGIISKKEALDQCDQWLNTAGFHNEKRGTENSTGAAAKRVSLLKKGPDAKLAAIASRRAKSYGLKILAKNIQDDPKNKTTFVLLENKARVESKVIGIIGINGKFGIVLKKFFQSLGLIVIGSDSRVPTGISNIDVVKRADVVIFAATAKKTVSAIRAVMKYTRENQLLMDITSIKQPAVKEMLKGKAQVVGLHPMFAPSVTFNGQTIVVCPARLTDPAWKTWVVNFLSATGTKRKWSNARVHDQYMLPVQVLPQSANLVNALVIMEMGVNVKESLDFTSPFYKQMFSQMGRFLSQDPDLYFSIFTQNQDSLKMFRKRLRIERQLIKIIKEKNFKEFARLFEKAGKHFGPDAIRDANEIFLSLNTTAKTIDGDNAITLEFASKDNRPGLLLKILKVFEKKQVNMTAISSVVLDPTRHRLRLTTEGSKSSESIRQALEKIENWKEPKIRVIT